MYIIKASRDPSRLAVDYGHTVETGELEDEAGLSADSVLEGLRRAEDERMRAAHGLWGRSERWEHELMVG